MVKKQESTEERWFRWDKMLNNGKHAEMIEEFDELFKIKRMVVVGDLVRREQALEELGVISFNKEKAKKEQRGFVYGSRRGKS